LAASALFDLPTGAVIVWALCVLAVVTGWLVKMRTNRLSVVAVGPDA
jgi:hypothetical protein